MMQKSNQVDARDVFDEIRRLKEQEKNRIEKENWIVNIMRSVCKLHLEQLGYGDS
jgi:hypothetical protein